MSNPKKMGLWPQPGGVDQQAVTVQKCLDYVSNSNPTFEELRQWFVSTFPHVKGGKSVGGNIYSLREQLGLIEEGDSGKFKLTKDGSSYLGTKDPELMYKILDNRIAGISDILTILKGGPLNLSELHEQLQNVLGKEWKSSNQTFFRINWLVSLGKVQHIGRNYLLPSAEAEDVVFTATTEPVNLEFIATTTGPAELVINSEVEAIVAELHESERDTTNPSRFEEAVARCFHFLGFEAKHIGGAGKADVLLRASLGSASYTVVIDAKTANGDVPDQRIDWLTLDEHKAKNKAQYCIVVGPSFKSDRVQQRAIGSGVTLFSTSMLEDIIRLHDSTPFDMIQLEDLFKEKGNPTNWRDDLNEYAASATLDYEAFTSIVQLLRDENLRGKERTAEQLEAVLEAKDVQCTEEQVSSILKFLELPPLNAVKKDKNGKYVIPISPETLVKKLERIQDSISSIKISSVS